MGSSFCDSERLNFRAFAWRGIAGGRESSYVGWRRYQFFEILLSKHSLSHNKYYFNLYEFLKQWIHAFVGKVKDRCFCWFPAATFVPLKGTQHGISIQSFINLGKTLFRISRLWNIAQTWFLARLFAYWSSFISQILGFLYWLVCIFIFDGVTVKTEYTMNNTTDLHGPCIIYIQVVITTPEGESWGYPILRSLLK